MAEADPLLGRWYERGRSESKARQEALVSDAATLEALLLKGRNRTDVGRQVIEELGYGVSLWNGARDDEGAASVSVQCGVYSERVLNSVVIRLPIGSAVTGDAAQAVARLRLVATIWEPAWAGIMSKQAMKDRDFAALRAFVDWMVYVPQKVGSTLPPMRVEPVAGLGSIVVVQDNPPQAGNSEDLARIHDAEAIISRCKDTGSWLPLR